MRVHGTQAEHEKYQVDQLFDVAWTFVKIQTKQWWPLEILCIKVVNIQAQCF